MALISALEQENTKLLLYLQGSTWTLLYIFVPKSLFRTMIIPNVRQGPIAHGLLTHNSKFTVRNQTKIPNKLSTKTTGNGHQKDKVQQTDKVEMLQDFSTKTYKACINYKQMSQVSS